jgi:hypothetical protein
LKKRSATKTSPQPPELRFFVDRSIEARSVIETLERAGIVVECHSHHFPPDAPDEVWLERAGREGWLVLHRDLRIRHRTAERRALIAAGVGAFVVVAGNLRGAELAALLERHLPRVIRLARHHARPFVAAISRNGVRLQRLEW